MRETAAFLLFAAIVIALAFLNAVFLWAVGLQESWWKYAEIVAFSLVFGWNGDRIPDWCRQKLSRPSPEQSSHGSPR